MHAQGIWKCEGVGSGTKFTEVDLDGDAEWVDYDEKVRRTPFLLFLAHRFVSGFTARLCHGSGREMVSCLTEYTIIITISTHYSPYDSRHDIFKSTIL